MFNKRVSDGRCLDQSEWNSEMRENWLIQTETTHSRERRSGRSRANHKNSLSILSTSHSICCCDLMKTQITTKKIQANTHFPTHRNVVEIGKTRSAAACRHGKKANSSTLSLARREAPRENSTTSSLRREFAVGPIMATFRSSQHHTAWNGRWGEQQQSWKEHFRIIKRKFRSRSASA